MCGKVLQLESVTQQRLGAATFQAEFVWPVNTCEDVSSSL